MTQRLCINGSPILPHHELNASIAKAVQWEIWLKSVECDYSLEISIQDKMMHRQVYYHNIGKQK